MRNIFVFLLVCTCILERFCLSVLVIPFKVECPWNHCEPRHCCILLLPFVVCLFVWQISSGLSDEFMWSSSYDLFTFLICKIQSVKILVHKSVRMNKANNRKHEYCCISYREHHSFLKLCLKLLSNHLALALAGGVATSILGRQAGPLRNLLFRLMDSSVPDEIQEVSITLFTEKKKIIYFLLYIFFFKCVLEISLTV